MSFSADTFTYLADLENNNSKDWFEANRDRYEAHWRMPALAFIDQVAQGMAALTPSLKAEARLNGSLRRINRDVRFSKDKTPYSPRLHLIFWTGAHPNRSPGFHIVLHSKSVGQGAGVFGWDKDTLNRYRVRIFDPDDRQKLLAAIKRAEASGATLGEPDLTRVPKGFEDTAETNVLIRHKSIVARTRGAETPPDTLIGAGAVDWALETARSHSPLLLWLQDI